MTHLSADKGRRVHMPERGQTRKAGRGWTQLRGEFKEVRELAQWMRDQVDSSGLTLRHLEADLPFGRDKISRSLNGETRPDWRLVSAIVTRCHTDADPRLRERRLAEARARWDMADPTRATRLARQTDESDPRTRHSDLERERALSDQLSEAWKRCATLEKSLGESQNMVLTLRIMTERLEDQVRTLTSERDGLRRGRSDVSDLRKMQRELDSASDRYQHAKAALERARLERDEAERLRAVAESQAQNLREQLERMRSAQGDKTDLHLPAPVIIQTPLRAQHSDDIDRALETADLFLTQQAAKLAQIADDLESRALSDSAALPRVIVGQAYMSDADNATISSDEPDKSERRGNPDADSDATLPPPTPLKLGAEASHMGTSSVRAPAHDAYNISTFRSAALSERELRQGHGRTATTDATAHLAWEPMSSGVDTAHSFALALQESMLPRSLKFGLGVRGAWRYEVSPTGTGGQVGGDWYDAVPTYDGSTILIIGDVEGHNVHAAGIMYRLRTAVRTYAAEKHLVDEVLHRAHEFVVEMNEEAEHPVFATCLIAEVDPAARTITASRAGHVPPIVVPLGRPAHVPHVDVGVPLGVPADARYPIWTRQVIPYEPGTRLLLCTDGLLEGIDKDVDQGLRRTLDCLDGSRGAGLEELAGLLLDANRPRELWTDDVAILLVELY